MVAPLHLLFGDRPSRGAHAGLLFRPSVGDSLMPELHVELRELLASWEPHDVRLKLSVTRSFALALDRVCADLRLTKSLVLREAVRRGLPALVNDVVYLRSQGYRSPAHLAGRLALTGRRGPKGEGLVSARWSERPGDDAPAPVPEPVVPDPLVDED